MPFEPYPELRYFVVRGGEDGPTLVVSAGAQVAAGQRLGVVRSLLGEPLQEAVSPVDGRVLFGESSLSISQGEPLAGIGR